MKLTNNDKKNILSFVIKKVDDISDKDYQKRVWIRGEGPEVDDFDETVCHFLHEGGGVLDKYKDFGITEIQYQLLKKFRDKIRIFADANDWPPEFIDTPEWADIMHMAKEVLKAFNYQKTSE